MELIEKQQTLVDIDREYRAVVDEIEAAGGELTPQTELAFQEKLDLLCAKTDAYGFVHGRLESEIEFWKQNKEHCANAEKVFKRGLESLRERMKFVLGAHPDKSLQGAVFRFFLTKGVDSLELVEALIPREYMKAQVILVPDRSMIERAIREGKEISGAKLKTDNSSLRKGRPKV